jgi:ABC-type sugar transport system substrate-binding protein
MWALLFAPLVRAADVSQLRAERADDGIYLSASLKLEIAPAVEDALSKGIPLIFVAEAEIYRERWYFSP